jgi:hypothetical protein
LLSACRGAPEQDGSWGLSETRQVGTPGSLGGQVAFGDEFSVWAPLGIERYRLALSARDDLVLQRGSRVIKSTIDHRVVRHGVVSSAGALTIEADAEVGAAYGLGENCRIDPGAVVDGYVRVTGYGGQIARETVRLGILEKVSPALEVFAWRVNFPTHPSAVGLTEGVIDVRMDPGAQGDAIVAPNSVLALRTGTYQLNRLIVEKGGTLEIDNTRGPVYIWVRDALEIHGSLMEYLLDGNVLIGYAGSKPVDVSGFRATLVAPSAELTVRAGPEANVGAFFARKIVLEPGAVVEHRPFLIESGNPPSAAQVCSRCAASAEAHWRSCCGTSGLATDAHQTNETFDACTSESNAVFVKCNLTNYYRTKVCENLGYREDRFQACPRNGPVPGPTP